MASDLNIIDAEGMVHVTLAGTVKAGDPIAHNGTNWVQADASDSTTLLYAQYIAAMDGVSGDIIPAYRQCTIYDADAPYTANTMQYLSETAGGVTETRPTTAASLIQVLGRSLDTYTFRADIKAPQEVQEFISPDTYDTTAEAGLGVIDSPAWVGPALDTNATTEDVYYKGRIPPNAISLSLARLVWNSIGETTTTISAAIITCVDGDTNTGDTGTAYSAAAPTGIADNKLCYNDITACFDTGAFKRDYNFTVACTAGGSNAGNLQAIGLLMRYVLV